MKRYKIEGIIFGLIGGLIIGIIGLFKGEPMRGFICGIIGGLICMCVIGFIRWIDEELGNE